jgi:hypothetical protein
MPEFQRLTAGFEGCVAEFQERMAEIARSILGFQPWMSEFQRDFGKWNEIVPKIKKTRPELLPAAFCFLGSSNY